MEARMPRSTGSPRVTAAPAMTAVKIHAVPLNAPLRWLRLGAADLGRDPLASLAWGILFALAGDIILLLALPHPHLFSLAISGFFLVAPLLAAGLYEISRRHERQEPVSYGLSLSGWGRNGQSLALFGLFLALLALLWERFSAILFSLTVDGDARLSDNFLADLFLSTTYLEFLLPWLMVGGTLAALVFALGVITAPMLIDRPTDIATAALTSLRATLANPLPLAIWAGLIVTLTVIGFATLLFGLIVLMPIIAHASWHAYRELVE
jgi:uncharacterized membrane protein